VHLRRLGRRLRDGVCLFLRVRALAEHACTQRSADLRKSARTTRAGWLARTSVAPLHVSDHLDHHLLPGVAYFHLPSLQRVLFARGVMPVPPGYWDRLRQISSREPA